MTTLSKNIQRLRVELDISPTKLAQLCGVTQAAYHQWVQAKDPYTPKPEKLLTLAGIFKTTVEELMTNPKARLGELVVPMLNFHMLTKVFQILDNEGDLSYAYNNAAPKQRAYMFTLLYSLVEDIGTEQISGAELLGMMDIRGEQKNEKKQKKQTVTRTKRHRGSGIKKK